MPSFSKQLLGFSKSVKMLLGVEKMALCGSEDDGTIGKKVCSCSNYLSIHLLEKGRLTSVPVYVKYVCKSVEFSLATKGRLAFRFGTF